MYRLLWGGLVSLGLQPFVEAEEDRLATVNTIKVMMVAITSLEFLWVFSNQLYSNNRC